MNVHINCRPRNLRNQGAQCARPKVRNVRSPRCAMCGVKARNVHNQCVANCTTGWLRMTTKHFHFKNQICCNIWFSGSRECAPKITKSWTCGSEHVTDEVERTGGQTGEQAVNRWKGRSGSGAFAKSAIDGQRGWQGCASTTVQSFSVFRDLPLNWLNIDWTHTYFVSYIRDTTC